MTRETEREWIIDRLVADRISPLKPGDPIPDVVGRVEIQEIDGQKVEVAYFHTEETCPGHVGTRGNGKVCARCGVHVDSLRPPEDGE